MRRKPPAYRDCIVCGETFEVIFENRAAKTCSPECSKESRRQYDHAYKRRNRAAIYAARKRARAENPEPFLRANRRYYLKNRDAVLASNAEWEKANRDAVNARRRARYAEKKRGNP